MAPPSDSGCGVKAVDVKNVFIGAGCNRVVNNVSWGPSSIVSFGAQNGVALFHPQDAQIWTTLPGHKAVVNCIRWLPSNKDAYQVQHADKHYLLSGSADGVILIWEIHPKERKAQSAAVAEIWLWEVGSWKAVCRLHSHSLTVTQMEFSHDGSFLLAVSRDRHFSVFSICRSGSEVSYQLLSRQETHKRIIWACSWNPFGHQFATGSRDKTVKIWAIEETDVRQILALPQFSSSVTALSWVGCDRSCNTGFLCVGMENGLIELWSLFADSSTSSKFGAVVSLKFDPFLCHVSMVNRLLWRDVASENSRTLQLASCGADHCVKVFEISFS